MARKSRKTVEAAVMQAGEHVSHVGAYVRLSAVDKKQKGDSIENQQAIISAHISEHPDLELTEVYIDNGLSGQTFERPAFQRMLEDLDSGRINCCITKDLSRLGRNAIDTGYYIDKYFPTRNIRYISINDNYDSADSNSNGIIVSIKNMVNEAYALDIGRKIRATKQMNIRNGCFVGRLPPYGYLRSDIDRHKLVPDEYAAPIIRRMFEMVADGQGVKAVQQWLNDSGILPPKRYFYSIGVASEKEATGHIHWSKSVVYTILQNRIYVGDMIQGKFKTQSYVQTKLPESEWVVTENTHVGIVSRELFAVAQSIHGSNAKVRTKGESVNIFLRKIVCGHCAHAMRRVKYKKSHGFTCSTQHDYSKGDCTLVSINEDVLKELLLCTLRKKAEVFTEIAPTAIAMQIDATELRSVQAELERKHGFLKGLYESLISGDITNAEYKEMKQSYETSIDLLSNQVRQLRESARLAALDVAKKSSAAENIGAVSRISELTAEIVDTLIDKIVVFEHKRLEIHFKFTDEIAMVGGADSE